TLGMDQDLEGAQVDDPGIARQEDNAAARNARHGRPPPGAAPTTRLSAARRRAYPGLTTSLIRRSRSSNGANALFIALIVSHSISPRPIPNAASRAANSDDI